MAKYGREKLLQLELYVVVDSGIHLASHGTNPILHTMSGYCCIPFVEKNSN